MNKLYDHVSFTVNYINSQDLTSNKTVSECGIQTDIYPMSTNLAHINNQGTILRIRRVRSVFKGTLTR
jgi:hypothetical protein